MTTEHFDDQRASGRTGVPIPCGTAGGGRPDCTAPVAPGGICGDCRREDNADARGRRRG